MSLSILNVAYPLAPVGSDAVGGAEQVLAQLDAALTRSGHHSIVVACDGSAVEGTLAATPRVLGPLDADARRRGQMTPRPALPAALRRWRITHATGTESWRT